MNVSKVMAMTNTSKVFDPTLVCFKPRLVGYPPKKKTAPLMCLIYSMSKIVGIPLLFYGNNYIVPMWYPQL